MMIIMMMGWSRCKWECIMYWISVSFSCCNYGDICSWWRVGDHGIPWYVVMNIILMWKVHLSWGGRFTRVCNALSLLTFAKRVNPLSSSILLQSVPLSLYRHSVLTMVLIPWPCLCHCTNVRYNSKRQSSFFFSCHFYHSEHLRGHAGSIIMWRYSLHLSVQRV